MASNTLVTRGSLLAYKGGAGIGSTVGRIEFAVATSTTKGTEAVDLTAPYTFSAGQVTAITVISCGSGYTTATCRNCLSSDEWSAGSNSYSRLDQVMVSEQSQS